MATRKAKTKTKTGTKTKSRTSTKSPARSKSKTSSSARTQAPARPKSKTSSSARTQAPARPRKTSPAPAGTRVKRARSESPAPRAPRRSVTDKARTLASLKSQREVEVIIHDQMPDGGTRQRKHRFYRTEDYFPVEELARLWGVPKSIVQQLRDDPNFKLSKKMQEKISRAVNRDYKEVKETLGEGAAFVKGKIVRHPLFRLPEMPVETIPVVHPSRSGESFTLDVETKSWSENDKLAFLAAAKDSGRFYTWSIRVEVPEGVGISGAIDSVPEINRTGAPIHYMKGPFSMYMSAREILEVIAHHENAGRIVANISLVQRREDLGL